MNKFVMAEGNVLLPALIDSIRISSIVLPGYLFSLNFLKNSSNLEIN
jgi:hypothetical protein